MLIGSFLVSRFIFPSMKINDKKRSYYVERLFIGEKKRVDSGKGEKKERISPDDAQGKEVVRRCKAKCDICGLSYMDPHQFAIHHINGDPEITAVQNLTLLCSNCHNSIHGSVNSRIKDYMNEQKRTVGRNQNTPKKTTKPKIVRVNCGLCGGSGRGLTGLYLCPVCQGEKQIEVFNPPEKCRPCEGTGKRLPTTMMCRKCDGTGYTNAVKKT